MFFYTHPNAEFSLPTGLPSNGQRSWSWVELGIAVPLFLVKARVVEEAESETIMSRYFWFGTVGAVQDLLGHQSDHFKILRVDLFSPGYMNGTDTYQLDELRQVWRHRDKGIPQLFVLADKRELLFNRDTEIADCPREEMELIFAL